jgi:glycosyltransferase involved in cell wall biosynthesis
MNVLIVIPGFPVNPDQIKGGVHSALANLLKGFVHLPIQIRVISFNRDIDSVIQKNIGNNITIHYHPEGKWPHAVNFLLNGSKVVKEHIRSFNPAIVHFAMGGYILLTKFFGIEQRTQVMTVHGMAFREAKLKKKLKDKLVFYTNGWIEWLFCPKNIIHISKYSRALFGENPNGQTVTIPNAIDSSYFQLQVKPTNDHRLLYAGAIDNNKNLLFLLNALGELIEQGCNYSLDVMGGYIDPDYQKEIEDFVSTKQLAKHIRFHGWVNQTTVQEVMAQGDILVVSSLQESLPMVIAEAMSAGKLVIGSKVGGIPEMIQHGETGFIFETSATQNLTTILKDLYQNPTHVQQMQLRAKAIAQNTYDCKSVARSTFYFYQQLLPRPANT